MTGLNGDERSATGSANFVVRDQLTLDYGAIVCCVNDACAETDWFVSRRRS